MGSLKFFHHVLRSRRFGGDAGVAGTGGCEGGLPWCAFELLDAMAGAQTTDGDKGAGLPESGIQRAVRLSTRL